MDHGQKDPTVWTLLPYPGFLDSARVRHPKRLGKQRIEALQVLRGLTRPATADGTIRPLPCGEGTRRPWSVTVGAVP